MTETCEGGRAWTVAWFALAHLLLLTIGFHLLYTSPYSDIQVYREYGRNILLGELPFRDFPAEYPPFAFVFFTLPASIGWNSMGGYYAGFVFEVIIADVAALFTLDRMARRGGQSRAVVLTAYTVLLAVLGPIITREFDIFPALFTLLAVSAFEADKDARGWFWLALGVMTKLYPILLAPVVLLRRGGRISPRAVLRGAAVGAGTCVVVMLPWLVLAPRSLLVFFRFHLQRGLQIETTYASVILAANALHLARAATENTFGSWNVIGWAATDAARASTWLLLAALIVAYAVCRAAFARGRTAPVAADTNVSLASCGALVLLATMLTSKVLSPQYLVWLLPLLALATGPGRERRWALFAAIAIVTYYIFPRHYNALVAIEPIAVAALFVRNLVLLMLTVVLGVDILRDRPGPRAERAA